MSWYDATHHLLQRNKIISNSYQIHLHQIYINELIFCNAQISGKKDSILAKVTDFGLSGLSSIMSGRAVVNPGMQAPCFWCGRVHDACAWLVCMAVRMAWGVLVGYSHRIGLTNLHSVACTRSPTEHRNTGRYQD